MRKLFVSQPMRGKTQDAIFDERRIAVAATEKYIGEKFEVIDSIIKDHRENNPLYCLGKSIQMMGEADIVCFADGWDYARGCEIEHNVAESYNIPIVEILPEGKCVIG